MKQTLLTASLALAMLACGPKAEQPKVTPEPAPVVPDLADAKGVYTQVRLSTDLAQLTEKEKQMIPLLIQAAQVMDDIYWKQRVGDKDAFLAKIADAELRKYALINYGPWDLLANDTVFVPGFEPKAPGGLFYPADMTAKEFEKWNAPDSVKNGLYSMVRRDAQGQLTAIPYHQFFKEDVAKASALLEQAAALAEDASLKKYLELRAKALLNDQYYESDAAWLDMQTNTLDIIIGPIETYEDGLFGYRASHEAYVLVKDKTWSERLKKYAALLPALQEGLPVDKAYKAEKPGSDSQLNAYDVIYYAGDCNSGSKTIAVNLPNDEKLQLEKGTRRSQLKNAMKAKFDQILLPIADELIDPAQRKHITFDAFFANTMFHEVAHGLGIKETINKKGTVRMALKDLASALEEGKADILGLYMVTKMLEQGHITEGTLEDYYVTFMAGIFRSVRFGASSAHGQANMVRFNYFQEKGAFVRNAETGKYSVDMAKMKAAMESLSALILTLQGNGDYNGVKKLVAEKGKIGESLQGDLNKLAAKKIPVDVVFYQGLEALGMK